MNLKLKTLVSFIFVLLFCSMAYFAYSAIVTKTLKFNWEQDAADLPELGGWNFYYSTTTGGPYQPWLDTDGNQVAVVYDPNMPGPTYSSTPTVVNLDLAPGSSATYYFVATAFDKQGAESDFSTEAINPDGSVGVEFKARMGIPIQLEVIVTINEQ